MLASRAVRAPAYAAPSSTAPTARWATLCSGLTMKMPSSLPPSWSANEWPPETVNPASPTMRYTAPKTKPSSDWMFGPVRTPALFWNVMVSYLLRADLPPSPIRSGGADRMHPGGERNPPGRAVAVVADLDVVELNEAFAAQSLACLRELDLPDDAQHVNANDGAIALGHPLGMSGARLALTAAVELSARGGTRGLAIMCIGVGHGNSVLIESAPS